MNLYIWIILPLAFLASFLLRFGRLGKRIGLLFLALIVSIVLFFGWRSHQFEKGYNKIEAGFSQQQIQELLGSPAQITDCATTYGGFQRVESEAIPGCVEEYWYYSAVFPEAWSVSFDKEKRVIHKYHWASP